MSKVKANGKGKRGPATVPASASAEKHAGGRPTLYQPEYNDQAYNLTLLRATDVELADALGVSVDTIYEWKKEYPEFSEAIKAGKTAADARISRSLYERAAGFEFYEEESHRCKNSDGSERVEVVKVRRVVPPDTNAIRYWLNNRQRANWRDVQHVEGNPNNPLAMFAGIKIVISNGAEPMQIESSPQPAQQLGGQGKPALDLSAMLGSNRQPK